MKLSSYYFILFFSCIFPFVLSQKGTIINVPNAVVNTAARDGNGCIPYNVNLVDIVGVSGQICGPPQSTISTSVSIFGVNVGSSSASLTEGITIGLNAFLVKGYLKFYLNQTCIRLGYEISVVFGPSVSDDIQVLCL
jgi:hypothetical protein